MGLFGLFGRRKNSELAQLREMVGALSAERDSLKSLCNAKDAAVKSIISDGLRHGSSEAGKAMVDLREYYKSLRK